MAFWRRKVPSGWQELMDTGLVTRRNLEWYRDIMHPESLGQLYLRGVAPSWYHGPTPHEFSRQIEVEESIRAAQQEIRFNKERELKRGGGKVDVL